MNKILIDIIVPTFNESESIKDFIKVLKKELKNFRIILVDDSTDDTALIAGKTCKELRIPAKIIKRLSEKGKGGAVSRGLKELTARTGVIIDADLEYHPKHINPMVKMLKEFSLVTSVRVRRDPLHRRILGGVFKSLVKILFGVSFETQSGLKVFRTKDVKNIKITSKGWVFDVELIYKILKQKNKIGVYEIEYTTREKGRSKIGILTPFQMLKDLLLLRLRL